MSIFLRIPAANTRSLADRRRGLSAGLAADRRRRKVARITVWSGCQSFPIDHRYPLTCGRRCVSPSHPPASFSPARPPALTCARRTCRQSASPRLSRACRRVTQGRNQVNLCSHKLLAKGAGHESSQTDSREYGIGVGFGRAIGMRPGRGDLAFGLFDGRVVAPLIPSPLTTTFKRSPAPDAPRGRFVVFSQTKKDHPCSTRS